MICKQMPRFPIRPPCWSRFYGCQILALILLLVFFCQVCNYDASKNDSALMPSMKMPFSDDSIIVYRAYLENTPSGTQISILAFGSCSAISLLNTSRISGLIATRQTQFFGLHDPQIFRKITEFTAQSIEKDCPWQWAPTCKWSTLKLTSSPLPPDFPLNSTALTLSRPSFQPVSLPLHRFPEKLVDGLAVCVPPLYWYADWLKLALFVESWRSIGVSKFVIYRQSVSATVSRLLDIYQEQGIVQVVPWGLLPGAKDRNSTRDPNESVYRLGHLAAINDCRFRAAYKFVAIVDVDEFILPIGGTNLPDYLRSKMRDHPLAGSFTFRHVGLHMPLWPKSIILSDTSDLNFMNFLNTVKVSNETGPTKVVLISDRVDIVLTHVVRHHVRPFSSVLIPASEAALYHARVSWIRRNATDFSEVEFNFNGFFADQKKNVQRVVDDLRQKMSPTPLQLNSTAIGLITACLSSWKTSGCKTPFTSCYSSLISTESWVIEPELLTHFVI